MATAPPYRRVSPPTVSPEIKNVLSSNWSSLEQAPPPTLREILAAYKSRGDGDREMLLAILNAKCAEDQRLAAIARLQQTLLEMYQGGPPSPYYPPPPAFSHAPPPPSHSSHHHHPYPQHKPGESSRSSDSRRSYVENTEEPPRKRHRRRSQSPSISPPSSRSYSASSRSASPPTPPPRHRSGMNIGSLVSAAEAQSAAERNSKGSTPA